MSRRHGLRRAAPACTPARRRLLPFAHTTPRLHLTHAVAAAAARLSVARALRLSPPQKTDAKASPVPEGDKGAVREGLIEGVIRAPGPVRSQLGECVRAVVYADYPERWPQLLQQVQANLGSQVGAAVGAAGWWWGAARAMVTSAPAAAGAGPSQPGPARAKSEAGCWQARVLGCAWGVGHRGAAAVEQAGGGCPTVVRGCPAFSPGVVGMGAGGGSCWRRCSCCCCCCCCCCVCG